MHAFDLMLLAFKGIAIASLPIGAIWVGRAKRTGNDGLRRLAWVTAFLTFDLIVFGGFTRLTDSGLGCPDWPGCYAKANPFMAASDIRDAEAALPYGPVSMSKAWIEMIHRYLAMAVGVLIVAMTAISVRRAWRARRGQDSPRAYPAMAIGLLALVVLQGAFGAWTVTQKLQPIFVTTHLVLGLTLLALLVLHALRLDARHATTGVAPPGVRQFAVLALIVLAVQVALGGWVSANYAVLACSEFPKCQGVWLPDMDFSGGFHLWRELGKTSDGGYLSVAALTAIHWAHRSFAAVVLAALLALWAKLRRVDGMARSATALVALLAAQWVTGLVNVTFDWPLLAAVLHNAGAAGLVTALVVINYRVARLSRPASLAVARSPVETAPSLSTLGRS